ncbi:hypothetical protein BH23BAC1_BH23BAC1_37910 [soil metagenome]
MKTNNSDLFSFLITNKDFRDWVLNPNEEISIFWKKWMEAHPESISEIRKAREFLEMMTFKKEYLSKNDLDIMLGKIISTENSDACSMPLKKNKSFYTLDQWIKVAAILIFFLFSAIVIDHIVSKVQVEPEIVVVEWRTVENPKGRKTKVFLPDGSIVNLNSGSEIKYPKIFSDEQRYIELKGEAFFEVTRDEHRPFIVKAEKFKVEVLGTSFNINAHTDSENHYVAVVSGMVKVSNIIGEAEVVNPNEMILIDNNNKIDKSNFDIRQITGWKDGIITFKRASFKDIQNQLSMWYGVEFILGNNFKMDNVYTGEFENETLENVLEGIAFSSGFEYRISDNKVFIYKNL